MDPKIQAMLELEKRGKLPEQFAPMLQEARKRGLIPTVDVGPQQSSPVSEAPQDGPPVPSIADMQALLDQKKKYGENVGTFLNKAGEAMTFGLVGDEASAALESLAPGVSYEDRLNHYRTNEAQFEKDHPVASLAAELGGAAIAPVGGIGAAGKGASLAKKAIASALATGAMGGTYGFMEGEGLDDRMSEGGMNAGVGALIGAAIPGVGALYQKAATRHAGNKAVREAVRRAPSTQDLRAAGNAAYQAVDDAGVQIKPEAFSRVRQEIYDALKAGGLDEIPGPISLTPKAARVNQIAGEMDDALRAAPTSALPFSSLDQFRRKAGVAASDINKSDAALGMKTIETLDDFVKGLGPDDVVSGDVEALPGLIEKARGIWSKMSKSQLIDDAIEAGEQQYLSGSGTGLKYQFKRILRNPKLAKGFSDAEKKMMGRVINGTVPEQLLRLAGSGITHIAAPMAGFGMAGGGVPGAVAGLGALGLSRGARTASDAIMSKNAEIVRALVAAGGVPNLPANIGQRGRAIVEQLMRQGTAAGIQ